MLKLRCSSLALCAMPQDEKPVNIIAEHANINTLVIPNIV